MRVRLLRHAPPVEMGVSADHHRTPKLGPHRERALRAVEFAALPLFAAASEHAAWITDPIAADDGPLDVRQMRDHVDCDPRSQRTCILIDALENSNGDLAVPIRAEKSRDAGLSRV